MHQTQQLIVTLKKLLKANGLTYRTLAENLGISESSIKRIFAEETFSLERLEQICQLLDINLSELVHVMDRENPRITQLTEAQEKQAAADPRLLAVAFLVINGWTYHNILDHYAMNEPSLLHYLLKLDKLRIIDLLPNNRIKLLISPNFSWRHNGPVQQALAQIVLKNFLEGDIEKAGGEMHFISGMLSEESRTEIFKRINHLVLLFNELKRQDHGLPFDQRHGFSMVLAIRPWRREILERMLCDEGQ